MSAVYTISVENERGANTNYATFMESPSFTGGQQPFLNVWYTTFLPYHGSFEIRTEGDFYACKQRYCLASIVSHKPIIHASFVLTNDQLRGWYCAYRACPRSNCN